MQSYETIPEILEALRKRRILVSRETAELKWEQLGMREPFGAGDLKELEAHLAPEHRVSNRVIKTQRILSAKE